MNVTELLLRLHRSLNARKKHALPWLVGILFVFAILSSVAGNLRRDGDDALLVAVFWRVTWIGFSLALIAVLAYAVSSIGDWRRRRRENSGS
jgi:hypothetical protein